MNLKNWFNFKYLYENIKKSKSLFILILTIFPLISGLTMLFMESASGGAYIPSLKEVSIVTLIGLFIIPIVITNALFGYVYKKKSVDFINSLPITRKSIFISNTLGGIVVIFILLLFNITSMLITLNLFTNCLMPFSLMIDYFVLWFITYVFVFIVSNLALSLSGNKITQVIVSVLIVFFIPFIFDYAVDYFELGYKSTYLELSEIESDNIPYYCYSDEECESKKNEGLYEIYLEKETNNLHNVAYSMIIETLKNDEYSLYNSTRLIYMVITTIFYILIGYYAFLKRKMEVCETTFKSYKTHTFIKCLTMLPFVILLWEYILDEGFNSLLLILITLLISYYYVYDLITRKGIVSFKNSLLYLTLFVILSFTFVYLISGARRNEVIYELDDFESVSFNLGNEELIIKDIENKDIIKKAIYQTYNYCDDSCSYTFFEFKINGKYYGVGSEVSQNYLNELKNDIYTNELENHIFKLDYNEVLGIKVNDVLYNVKEHSTLINLLKQDELSRGEEILPDNVLSLYYYTNHELKNYYVSITNPLIANYVVTFSNNESCKLINNLTGRDNFMDIVHDDYDYVYDYLVEYYKEDVISYLKGQCNKEFDFSNNYLYIYITDYNTGKRVTNYIGDVEGFYSFIDTLVEKGKNNTEYQEFLNDYYGVDDYEYDY